MQNLFTVLYHNFFTISVCYLAIMLLKTLQLSWLDEMNIIDFLWCSAGSIFVSFFDFKQPNSTSIVWKTGWKSDDQNWESIIIFWIHIISFFFVNALFAYTLSYFLYKTDLIIDLKCNSALTNFIKIGKFSKSAGRWAIA